MATNWSLEDQGGSVYILKDEPVHHERSIYKKSRAELRLLYNAQERMVGYTFKYSKEHMWKFSLYNSFGIVYNRKEQIDLGNLKFETIFEDQVIRLSAWEHPNEVKDYFLVGRWRSGPKEPTLGESNG